MHMMQSININLPCTTDFPKSFTYLLKVSNKKSATLAAVLSFMKWCNFRTTFLLPYEVVGNGPMGVNTNLYIGRVCAEIYIICVQAYNYIYNILYGTFHAILMLVILYI